MRKELLLGTTALLVGAIAAPEYVSAAEPLRLSVRGYKNEFFGLGDADDDTNNGINGPTAHFSDGEVHFRGDTTLDNGLTVGVQIELEAIGANTGDTIDEAYTWISGDFGKVTVGSENTEGYQMLWGGTAPNVGVPINSGWITVFTSQPAGSNLGFRRTGLTTNATLTNDAFHIRYRSPRFAGFQFGASYAPTDAGGGDPKNFPGLVDEDAETHDIFDVGANFSESFNGIDVYVVGVYERGTIADDLEDTADAAGEDCDDPQIFKGGANIGFSGFTVGGSYANQFEGLCSASVTTITKTDSFLAEFEELSNLTAAAAAAAASSSTSFTSTEGQSWDVGASYATGPWAVSFVWFHGEEEGSTADSDDDEVDAFVGAVSYALGPGITTSLSGYYGRFDNEDGVESDSVLGILGLAISF